MLLPPPKGSGFPQPKKFMKTYIELFTAFFKLGAFTFGGGYAMLPLLQKEIVENKHWATEEELMDYFAVGQCTPGIIAVNTATFIGYYKKGILGGIIATLGIVAPSILIILIIASVLQNFADIEIVQHGLAGIRIAVCVLVLNAVLKMAKSGIKDKIGILIFIVALVLTYFSVLSTVWVVILSGAFGVLIQSLKAKRGVQS